MKTNTNAKKQRTAAHAGQNKQNNEAPAHPKWSPSTTRYPWGWSLETPNGLWAGLGFREIEAACANFTAAVRSGVRRAKTANQPIFATVGSRR